MYSLQLSRNPSNSRKITSLLYVWFDKVEIKQGTSGSEQLFFVNSRKLRYVSIFLILVPPPIKQNVIYFLLASCFHEVSPESYKKEVKKTSLAVNAQLQKQKKKRKKKGIYGLVFLKIFYQGIVDSSDR